MATRIHNHYSASLSKLDLEIAKAVPPGGNWKNIPETVPSRRLEQIRISYAAGGGSRSTYYGRLQADAPSYTITTYVSRPGNGCHLHYDPAQDRVLSQREAARLQSFPDSFVFKGSNSAVYTMIGNSVPPLLAYQIARSFPFQGHYVDLFSGAGGLSLGFTWAGWQPLVANDIQKTFLETYAANIHQSTVLGDIRDRGVFDEVLDRLRAARADTPDIPLLVLGGPPCQGFSTAGNKRSMGDGRNWLFRQYHAMLEAVQPDGFVFENVTGLLNMEGGTVLQMILQQLQESMPVVDVWKMRAEQYGVPQRRTRVVIVGSRRPGLVIARPPCVTAYGRGEDSVGVLPPAVTVGDALADLPALEPGEDGSGRGYTSAPRTRYQEFMRALITAEEYLQAFDPPP